MKLSKIFNLQNLIFIIFCLYATSKKYTWVQCISYLCFAQLRAHENTKLLLKDEVTVRPLQATEYLKNQGAKFTNPSFLSNNPNLTNVSMLYKKFWEIISR